jgi:hypothetical protein
VLTNASGVLVATQLIYTPSVIGWLNVELRQWQWNQQVFIGFHCFKFWRIVAMKVKLVNAHHVKTLPGRKTDVLDCQWLQQLHSYGLLSGSFRPENEICVLRSYIRQRDNLIRTASVHIQRMQKALTQMNIQLHQVISDITGTTGMAIIRAIVAL